MKFAIILFFVFSVICFAFFFGLAVIFKVVGAIAGILGRTVTEERDEMIVDVTAEYKHTEQEKALMAARSIAASFINAEKVEDLGSVMPLFVNTMRKVRNGRVKATMIQYREIMGEINSIIRYHPNFFAHTNALLAQSTCGFEQIVSRKESSFDESATGMVYAAEYVLDYMIKLSDLADLANIIGQAELKGELSRAIEQLERLDWATIVYPNHNKSNINALHDMASRVAERIQTYLQAKSYGVNNSESTELYTSLMGAATDLNKALSSTLATVANWDLIQAGAELEAMRQELKLRGLY